jgi:hypothetical protein
VGEVTFRLQHSGGTLGDDVNVGIHRIPIDIVMHRFTFLEHELK